MTQLDTDVTTDIVKDVNRRFVTGVTVITTQVDDTPKGLAVNAFTSVSLEPPTIMVCVQKTSNTHDSLFRSSHLAVNILSVEQGAVAATFASKSTDKFAEIEWTPGPHGSPLLANSSAVMEVEIRERLQANTHTVFVCRVRHADVTDIAPMVYSAGKFFDGGALSPLA